MTASGGDYGGGVIFSFDPSTSTYQKLYSFNTSTGNDPNGRLTLDPNCKTLYGMTREGGTTSNGHDALGVVFSVNTDGSDYKVLHAFAGKPSDGATSDHGYVVQSGSCLYGMTTIGGSSNNGVIFKLMTDGSNYMILYNFGSTSHDGTKPIDNVILLNQALYGMTTGGGDYNQGTVFEVPSN